MTVDMIEAIGLYLVAPAAFAVIVIVALIWRQP